MVFSSMIFVFLFFAAVIVIHGSLKSIRAKNICLLVASLIFYSWASFGFTAILLFEVLVCWVFARMIENRKGKVRRRLLIACIAIQLSLLCVFKYLGFFLENFRLITGVPEIIPEIVLPLGISFYTFQLISYVVDVYRSEVDAQQKYWMLLLYASLFHQCVAGPIVRYSDLFQELQKRTVTTKMMSNGISRFTVGLAKKAILANACALVADAFFSGDASALAGQPAAGLWLSGLAYMLQIYLDFSAYSDMAVGMGLMCGFFYPENFRYPYLAHSVTDFWRCWHMTLSSFFRDYVYIPLGGNRRGLPRQIFNLFVVWLLTGFWHGASWNYVIWGLYFFVFLVAEKLLTAERLQKIPKIFRHLGLLVIVYFCWIIFRFEDLSALWTVFKGLFGLNGNPAGNAVSALTFQSNWVLLAVAVLACTPIAKHLKQWLRHRSTDHTAALAAYATVDVVQPVLFLILSAMVLTGNSYNPFIYWTF